MGERGEAERLIKTKAAAHSSITTSSVDADDKPQPSLLELIVRDIAFVSIDDDDDSADGIAAIGSLVAIAGDDGTLAPETSASLMTTPLVADDGCSSPALIIGSFFDSGTLSATGVFDSLTSAMDCVGCCFDSIGI